MTEVLAGQSVAGYQLIELVGAGGMGRVYRATQPGVDRVVAVKVIRPELATDRAFRDRFRDEARLAASIDHPSVIPVYEADEVDGVLFVAMRWLDGSDLQALLAARGPLDPAEAVRLLRQLASGLDAAHAAGLIHRDIKPANVLLEGEHAFLSDFGLARLTDSTDQSTQIGGLVGTVDYLAPELVTGGAATVASDVYALGCVLFEMLTGTVPYPVDGLIAKLHAHTRSQPPVASSLSPALPRGFDSVIARALSKAPEERFASAGQLAEAAERAVRTRPRRPPRRLWAAARRRPALLFAGLAVPAAFVVALVLALGGVSHNGASAHANGRSLPLPGSLRPCGDLLTVSPGDCRNPQGGVDVVGVQGTTARLHSMDFQVTKVIQSRIIVDPVSQDTITAPRGTRFVIIECAIANRLRTAQVFEPDEFHGRQTGLFLYDHAGTRISFNGPNFTNYSEQNLPAVDSIPLSLLGKHLHPLERYDVPFTGVLVFSYPDSDLDSGPTALLTVHEFGRGISDERSVGVFRLPLRHSQLRSVYKAAVI